MIWSALFFSYPFLRADHNKKKNDKGQFSIINLILSLIAITNRIDIINQLIIPLISNFEFFFKMDFYLFIFLYLFIVKFQKTILNMYIKYVM